MRITLQKEFFKEKEYMLVSNGSMRVTAFRYSTGVEALKVENSRGYFIILPFQGQQVWRIHFDGRDLVMKTKFDEPVPTTEYLKTYGGFLLHCGVCAFGVPQADDNHPLHGETPNAVYRKAYIECGENYIAVGGSVDYDVSFTRNYTFSPECRLYEDDTVLKVSVELENRRMTPMEYMYLCHINFRPMDGAELMYTADYDKEHVKVFKIIADNVPQEKAKALRAYMDAVQENPALHHKVGEKGQLYDPEICFSVQYKGDEHGRAYTMQYTGDGACYVSHPTDILSTGIRWISRTGDEDSMGMVLPATGEHLGYQNTKRRGEIKLLPPNGKVCFMIEAGYLEKARADEMKKKIEMIKKK